MQRHYSADRVPYSKAMVFPLVMYSHESWTITKAEHQRTVVLEKTPESPLDSKEIKPAHLKGNEP